MQRIDWNRIADDYYNGVQGEHGLRALLEEAAEQYGKCGCSQVPRPCMHVVAAGIVCRISIVEHPDDCPECVGIREMSES